MGKAQSKRSVDITTDSKKTVNEEITEKVEKIEDTDHEAVSAAVSEIQSQNLKEELPTDAVKDIVVENNVDAHGGGGDSVANQNQNQNKSDVVATCKENDTANDDDASSAAVVEDTSKKMKKEKVKKKWSFRSISFGRKDKQKPSKTEEVDDHSPTSFSNGNAIDEKSPNQQNDSHGIDQLVKVEEALEKQVGNHDDDNDKKTADDKTTTITPTQTEEQLPEQQTLQQQNIINDSSHTNSTNNCVKENDINVNVPNEIITEPEINVTEAMTEKKTEHLQAQNSLPPAKDECNNAADIDMSLAKNTSCVNGFTAVNVSAETNNCQNVDAANLMAGNDNVNGDGHDDDKDLNNTAIPFKSIIESMATMNSSDNNSCGIITEQSKPQIEVIISDASTISATADDLFIATRTESKKSQEYYHSHQDYNTAIHSIQSNDETLVSKHDNVPDSIATVVIENNQVVNIDIDKESENANSNENQNENENENENLHSLPLPPPPLPPIPTSPPPNLDPSDYSMEQNIISIDNNYEKVFIQNTNGNDDDDDDNDSINHQQESNKNDAINDVIPGENQILLVDHQHHSNDEILNSECTEEQIPIITSGCVDEDKTEVNIMQNAEQTHEEEKSVNINVNVNGTEYNEHNCANHSIECENEPNIIAHNVIDELTANAIEIVDQQNVINCCNESSINNKITIPITNNNGHNDGVVDEMVATLMKDNTDTDLDVTVKKSSNTTEIDHVTKNESLIQINGINNEVDEIEHQQQQLIEQFDRKMCLITEAGNVDDEHGNLIESL